MRPIGLFRRVAHGEDAVLQQDQAFDRRVGLADSLHFLASAKPGMT
jgi:hypothetical protein